MNNARYIELVLELLPDSFAFDRFRVEYKAAAKAGDIFHPVIQRAGGRICILLNNSGDKPYMVAEFQEKD